MHRKEKNIFDIIASQRRGLARRLAAGLLACMVYFLASPFAKESIWAGPAFHFQNFSSLKVGNHFGIYRVRKSKERIGSGRLYILTPSQMHFSFAVKLPLYSISASVRLHFLGRDKAGNYKVRLEYVGMDNGIPRSAREIVTADAFLVEHGILSLKFMKQKHFLQLSVNSRGENRLVTEWGSAELRPE